ncbi:MAG TPA: hypothetical protein VGL26_04590 [Jatrophihabitans sp.]|jgi:hypothetical protein
MTLPHTITRRLAGIGLTAALVAGGLAAAPAAFAADPADTVTLSGTISTSNGGALTGNTTLEVDSSAGTVTPTYAVHDNVVDWQASVLRGTINILRAYTTDLTSDSRPYADVYYGGTDYDTATRVVADSSKTGLGIVLMPSLKITGAVAGDATHTPTGRLSLIERDGTQLALGTPNTDGTFNNIASGIDHSDAVSAGNYQLYYGGDAYFGKQYLGPSGLKGDATPLSLSGDTAISPSPWQLKRGYTISGTITGAATADYGTTQGPPLALYTAGPDASPTDISSSIGPGGTYALTGVVPGSYKLKYGAQWLGGDDVNSATTITVSTADITGQNFTVQGQGSVKGSVLGAAGSIPSGILAQIVQSSSKRVVAVTGAGPDFFVDGLAPGHYFARFIDANEVYNTATSADFTITANQTLTLPTEQLLKLIKNTKAPSISGTPTVGKTLKAKPGLWSAPVSTPKYQWLRSGRSIKGATKSSYKVTKSDAGKKLTVRVTAAPQYYKAVNAVSKATKPVRAKSKTVIKLHALGGNQLRITIAVTSNGPTLHPSGTVRVAVAGKRVAVKVTKGKATRIVSVARTGKVTVAATYAGATTVGSSKATKKSVRIS